MFLLGVVNFPDLQKEGPCAVQGQGIRFSNIADYCCNDHHGSTAQIGEP